MAKISTWRVYITWRGAPGKQYVYRVRARSARGAEGLARNRYYWWFPDRQRASEKGISSISSVSDEVSSDSSRNSLTESTRTTLRVA